MDIERLVGTCRPEPVSTKQECLEAVAACHKLCTHPEIREGQVKLLMRWAQQWKAQARRHDVEYSIPKRKGKPTRSPTKAQKALADQQLRNSMKGRK